MREKLIEGMAEAIYKTKYPNGTSWSDWGVYAAKNPGGFDGRATSRRLATAALDAALDVLETPSEEMWGGLARQLIMWMDMGNKTPAGLLKHLERSGRDVPDWLRDEPEMQALNHVPSKGTRAVLVFRAMLATLRSPKI